MKTNNRSVVPMTYALCLAALFVPVNLFAVGFRLPNQDPEAIARGDAFAATADNPSAIYYNPAGITQLDGDQIRAGLYVISADTEFTSPTGVKAHTDTTLQPVPQLYYVHTFKDSPISVGLGMYAPYGLSIDYGNNTPFRTVAESGSLVYLCFNPVVAWKVFDSTSFGTLSIAAGPTFNYGQVTFKRAIGILPNDEFKFDGEGYDTGFNAGLLWQPHPMWAFGVNYRYATTINFEGKSTTRPSPPLPSEADSTSGSVNFPQFIVGGVSFRPTTNWNLEADVDWTQWSGVKQIWFRNTAFGSVPLTLNYRDSFMYEFGVTRELGKGYFASVGYIYSENSSPDSHYSPLIPDGDLHLGSVGIGYRGKHWDWMAAFHFAYSGKHTVSGDANAAANGTYETFNKAFNIAATYKF